MAIVNSIGGFAADMAEWRHHIHSNPELGFDCHDTADFIVARLREFGVDQIETGVATSGVVAVINGTGSGPVTGLRADMDALPMQEVTGAPWASTVDGRMHACGHDGHVTMLLGAARYLCETRAFRGQVVLVFQPAEEWGGGGRVMVEDGVLDRYGIEEVYALHTTASEPLGTFSTTPGPIMAAVDDFEITVTGQGGHAAYVGTFVDPMPCAFAIGQALQGIVARETDPLAAAVVSLTQIHGGTAFNIIPDQIMMGGTVRSLDVGLRDTIATRIRTIAAGQAAAYGVKAEVQWHPGYPPTVNSEAQARFAVTVAQEVSGSVIDNQNPEMGAEDFSYMLEKRPGAFVYIGQGRGPLVHNASFDFNDEAAPYGASFFAKLIEMRHR